MKNSIDTIGNQTRDLPACSAVPQPSAPPHVPAPSNYSGQWTVTRSWIQGGLFLHLQPVHIMRERPVKADPHIACRIHAVPLPCHAAKGLERVFTIWFTQCGCVWFTLAMPRSCHALTMPFFSRPRHSTAVKRWPVGYLPTFGFFWLTCGVPQRLLSEAYQSSSQRSIPATVKSGSSTLQKGRSVKLLD
jgi:hypothetical protein